MIIIRNRNIADQISRQPVTIYQKRLMMCPEGEAELGKEPGALTGPSNHRETARQPFEGSPHRPLVQVKARGQRETVLLQEITREQREVVLHQLMAREQQEAVLIQ